MDRKGVKRESNEIIFKFQKDDVVDKLKNILGENFRKYRDDFDKTQNYPKTKFVPQFPITISLELVNRCNLNCIMCYKKHHAAPLSELSTEILQKIMRECEDNHMPSMILGLGSETLLYRNVKTVIEMVKNAGIQDVFFGTNGTLLTDEIIELLVKNQISRVEISIDSSTPETYKKIRGADMLKVIEKNIEKLLETKKKYNSPLPMVRLCFVVMDINKHEIDSFLEKWKDKVDYIDFQRCIDFSQMDKPVDIDPEVIKDSFCSYPFYSLNIWANGDVSPCCTFYGKRLIIGNIHNESLKDIWNSNAMKTIRDQIISKNFNPVCRSCLYFRDRKIIENAFTK